LNNESRATTAKVAQNYIHHPSENALNKYIKNIGSMNKSTAYEYQFTLTTFAEFIFNDYSITLDRLIIKLKEGSEDPYEILSGYVSYLQTGYNISASTLKERVITAKNFLEYHDVDISPRKFKLKVKMLKIITKSKEALSKEDIIDILNACSDIRLKTYAILLAVTGMRATEALSIRIKDLDLKSNPAKVFVRGEYTKTKTDRIVFLTEEITQQLNSWLNYKYRTRRVCRRNEANGNDKKTITEQRTPERNDNDVVFAVYEDIEKPDPRMIYYDLATPYRSPESFQFHMTAHPTDS
jgi:integrase